MDLYRTLLVMLVVYVATLCAGHLLRKPLLQARDRVVQKLHPYTVGALITWLLGVMALIIVVVRLIWGLFTREFSLIVLLQQMGTYGILLGFGWLIWFLVILVLIVPVSVLGIITFPLVFIEAYGETRDARTARARAVSVSLAALRFPWKFYLVEVTLCGGAQLALMVWLSTSNQPASVPNYLVSHLWWLGSVSMGLWVVKLLWQGRRLMARRNAEEGKGA